MEQKYGYKIKIKMLSFANRCRLNPGDEWIISNDAMFLPCPTGFCGIAFHAFYPEIRAMKYGPESPSESDKDVIKVCCPDYGNPAVFEITRIRE